MKHLPLSSIRIVDLTRVLAGPMCTMMLGDLGAEVIKVERRVSGDETRGWGPPFDSNGVSAYFLSINRNKLSLAADLHSPADRDVVLGLIQAADVVVENFLPGAVSRLGIDIESVLRSNPRLIWCTISGFGADSTRPGYDVVVQAEAGWMAISGEPTGVPMKSGIALADVIAGKDAAVAILAALIGRTHETNRHLVISLVDSARAALVNVAQNTLVSGEEAKRWGNAHANLVPYQLFQARDRAIIIAAGSDEQWRSCARALALPDLLADDALATNAGRVASRARVVAAIGRAVSARTAEEWMVRLRDAGVPCGVVKTVLEAIRETSASAVFGMPSSVGGTVRFPPPLLDQHGDVIRRVGWEAFRGYL